MACRFVFKGQMSKEVSGSQFEGVTEYGPEAFWSNVSFLCGFERIIYQLSKYDVKELELGTVKPVLSGHPRGML